MFIFIPVGGKPASKEQKKLARRNMMILGGMFIVIGVLSLYGSFVGESKYHSLYIFAGGFSFIYGLIMVWYFATLK